MSRLEKKKKEEKRKGDEMRGWCGWCVVVGYLDGDLCRVDVVHVEACAELGDAGCDLVKGNPLLVAICSKNKNKEQITKERTMRTTGLHRKKKE